MLREVRYPPSFASLVLARELLFQSRHQVLVYERREEHHLLLPVRRVVVGANLERDVSVTVLASQPTEVAPLRQRRPRPAEVAEAHGLIGIEIVALELLRGDPLGAFERVLRVDRHRGARREDVRDERRVPGDLGIRAVLADDRLDRSPEPLDDLSRSTHYVSHVHGEHRAAQERAAGSLAVVSLGALFSGGGGGGILASLGRLPQLPEDVALPPRRGRPPDTVLKPRPRNLRGPAAGTSRLARDGVAERARGAGAHVALGLELFDGLVAERIRQAGQRGAKIVP